MEEIFRGHILKMRTELNEGMAHYFFRSQSNEVGVNRLVGRKVRLEFTQSIECIETHRPLKKTYGQGYSYDAFMSLPECDTCIVRPELCHFDKGTCRDPEWGKKNCFRPHIVYISNTSAAKIGITRESQVPTRWIDQGATEALAILKVSDRKSSGLIEVELKNSMADKTNWRNMLKGVSTEVDLEFERDQLYEQYGDIIDELEAEDLEVEAVKIDYPVLKHPEKVTSLSFDKQAVVEGQLMGIKGQYFIFDCGVINIRKHQGYEVILSTT